MEVDKLGRQTQTSPRPKQTNAGFTGGFDMNREFDDGAIASNR